MQVTVEQLDPCKVQLTIEVDPETVAKTIDEVYREYNKVTAVPGFRKGKTPRVILERYVSEDSIKQRAIETMAPDAYAKALAQEDIEPYADPEMSVDQYEIGKPFIFKTIVPLPPKIELGEYKGIQADRRKVEITDTDVEDELKYMQNSRATTEPVDDRGVEADDIVIADIVTNAEGEEPPPPRRSLIRMGQNSPGFDENILGVEPSESKSFSLEVPADAEGTDMAGKTIHFEVTVDSIRARKLPELNDEFAKSIGDYENLDALKEFIRAEITTSANDKAEGDVERSIIDEIVSRSNVNFPGILTEHDLHHELEDMKERLTKQGMTLQDYVAKCGKTPDQFLAEMRETVSSRIRTGLALGEIAEKEALLVTDDDVEAEIDRIAEESKTPRESVEALIDTRGGKDYLKNNLLNKRILDYIKSVSIINQ